MNGSGWWGSRDCVAAAWVLDRAVRSAIAGRGPSLDEFEIVDAADRLFRRVGAALDEFDGPLPPKAAHLVDVLIRFHLARIEDCAERGQPVVEHDIARLGFCTQHQGLRDDAQLGALFERAVGQLADWVDQQCAANESPTGFGAAVFTWVLHWLELLVDADLFEDPDDLLRTIAMGHLATRYTSSEGIRTQVLLAIERFEAIVEPDAVELPPAVDEHLAVLAAARRSGHDMAPAAVMIARDVLVGRFAVEASGGDPTVGRAAAALVTALLGRSMLFDRPVDLTEATTRAHRIRRRIGAGGVDTGSLPVLLLAIGQAFSLKAVRDRDVPQAKAAIEALEPLLADRFTVDPDIVGVALAGAAEVLADAEPASARLTLERAITRTRGAAVRATAVLRGTLGRLWFDEWIRDRSEDALDRAIACLWEVVHSENGTPNLDDTEKLGYWLFARYEHRGLRGDLRNSAAVLHRAMQDPSATPALVSDAVRIAEKAGYLTDPDHLRLMVQVLERLATAPVTEPPSRCRRLVDLSYGYVRLHHVSDDPDDLRRAVGAAELAEQLGGDRREMFLAAVRRLTALLLLGVAAGVAPDLAGEAARSVRPQLAKVRSLARTDTEIEEVGHLELQVLLVPVERGTARTGDREAAAARARELAEAPGTGASLRRDAARHWAVHCEALERYAEAATAYRTLVREITDRTWRVSGPADRRTASGVELTAAQDGAACALLAGAPLEALALLEFGRQHTRRPGTTVRWTLLHDVRRALPQRTEELDRIRDGLIGLQMIEQGERDWDKVQGYFRVLSALPRLVTELLGDDPLQWLGESGAELSQRETDRMIRRIADHREEWRTRFLTELAALADEARLEAEPAVDAASAATLVQGLQEVLDNGMVVAVSVSRLACHMIVISSEGMEVRQLVALTAEAAFAVFRELQHALAADDPANSELDIVVTRCLGFLWDAIADPVRTELTRLGRPPGTRVWWYVPGFVGALPLHAAAPADGSGETMMRAVVSSYTASLSTLLSQLRRPPLGCSEARAVVLPAVGPMSGLSLPAAEREVATVSALLQVLGMETSVGGARIDDLAAAVGRSTWLHAACHGQPSVGGVCSAGLYTAGGFLSSTRLSWSAPEEREFAYLSSCHSAVSMGGNPDECEHLAAELQEFGYRQVVATLWAANDRAAERVARGVYRQLGSQASPTPDGARALNAAVCDLVGCLPAALWIPFVHFGV